VSLGIVGHKRRIRVTGVRKKEKKMRSQDISFLSIIVDAALVAKNNNDDNIYYTSSPFVLQRSGNDILHSHTVILYYTVMMY